VAERHPMIGRAAGAAFRRATWITACSDDLRARAIALGSPPDRTETVPYGVDAGRFAPSPERRAEVRRRYAIGDSPLIVSAGRLVSKKGFEYLIRASGQLATTMPRLRVLIAGDGDLRDDLARLAAAVPGVVTLIGNQSQDEIAALAAAADAIAVPSVHDEAGNVDGLPNFALEALASGTPVVASRVGGLPQAVTDGVSGLLVPERDASALSSALEYLLANPGPSRAFGAAARAAVIEHFGWNRVAERYEHLYDASPRTTPLS
jgi:glycosyltransferase involved in cell wall biosynthesis